MPARVGLLAQAVRPRGGLVAEGIGGHDRLAALRKAVILSISLTPGVVSTPEETSTSRAPVRWIASATLAGVRPPDSAQGSGWRTPSSKAQSKRSPMPPGAGASSGVLARSEEHTSELQSLMRISYAVFCW